MKKISIQDLKSALSSVVAEAEAGGTILITRHNEPVALLTSARPRHVHRGSNVGKGGIRPAIKRGVKLPYLEILLEDRGER